VKRRSFFQSIICGLTALLSQKKAKISRAGKEVELFHIDINRDGDMYWPSVVRCANFENTYFMIPANWKHKEIASCPYCGRRYQLIDINEYTEDKKVINRITSCFADKIFSKE